MPVSLTSNRTLHDWRSDSRWPSGDPSAEFEERSSEYIHIGLINNMADAALVATERQFLLLLNAASAGIQVRLSLYALPGVPRGEAGERHLETFYQSTENLFRKTTRLDGLIVTGREPLAPSLDQEPYWDSFTRVLEWARHNTPSTVWSCLAAHAAVLHMDGIKRIKSNEKICGIFECGQVGSHPLTAGAQARFALPHSRWNGVPENALTASGYSVLTRAAAIGVDTFVKDVKSLFVFFQGHPEYESNTLLLEYRRDVGRFLRGESNAHPSIPRKYFDSNTVNSLTALREKALLGRREDLLAEVSAVLANTRIANTWQATAACIYGNWLNYIRAQKQLRMERSGASTQVDEVDGVAPILSTFEDASV